MIKAKIKSSPKWKEYKTCSLGISLQSQNHVGEKLGAMVDWINATGQFERCVIDLSDTLHRHNFVLEKNMSYPAAHKKTLALGDEWIDQNRMILERLSMPYEIVRWDHWLSDPRFETNKELFYAAFNKDQAFRAALLRDTGHYFERIQKKLLSDIPNEKLMVSVNYLLEELAAHALFFEKYPCATIYPGRQQESFKLVREGLVADVPKGMTNSCFIAIFLHDIKADAAETASQNSSGFFQSYKG